ncbi:cenpa [Ecytonucleospora hepatopenaei]|uniref:Cenpa n=1 Tax=Ecytonucleospora hepatopenaei TaxID=646526 RepID=A0A1W0E4A9_9MICR|nr:cenpa [Ecytonucleospora hepatopenaei]
MVKAHKFNRKNSSTVSGIDKTPERKTHKKINTQTTTPSKSGKVSVKTIKQPGNISNKPMVVQGSITPKHKKRTNVFKEIKYFQKNIGFLVAKQTVKKLIRDIVNTKSNFHIRMNSNAFSMIQEALEAHIVNVFEYANLIARHAKRVTVFPSDIQLVIRIRG